MSATQRDPFLKSLLRKAFRASLLLQAVASIPSAGGRGGGPRVYYGGARPGNVGGPLVKVKRLQEYFPQHRWTYNVVYLLSNAPYLPRPALALMKARGIPMVLNQNGVFYPGWYAGDWQRQNAIMGEAYHLADHVFWQSAFCRRAANRFLGERSGPGEVLFNAVDVQRFTPTPVQRGKGPVHFLLTGKIGAHLAYRLESTIAGLAHARKAGLDADLTISGWVAQEAQAVARAKARTLGLPDEFLTFTGAYTQEQAPEIYRSADIYVMTKYLDPCPNTVLEAMACGLPIVYSASGGVPELVGPDAGIGIGVPEQWDRIHEPDPAALGDAMLAVATACGPMGQAARARAEQCFDIRQWIGRHQAVFEALLEQRSR